MTDDTVTGGIPCPSCGAVASGNFCGECGAALGGRFCNECGSELTPGSKFCSECGAAVGAGAAAPAAAAATRDTGERRAAAAEAVGGQNLPWWIAGAAMFVMIFMIGLNMVQPGGPPAPTAGTAPAVTPTGGTPPDLSQITPTQAADQLFNRVMGSVEAGDDAAAQQFMPMAIAAHQRAEPLDLDRRFHLSWLNRLAGNFEAALADAVEILDQDPNHLLGLASAAEASIELGEFDAAADYYRHMVEIYDAEAQRPLPEYSSHARIVTVLKRDAERFLAGR
ncbi:MAG: zinc-ribbon domain-containing protein [Gemmatimonadota bacterium]